MESISEKKRELRKIMKASLLVATESSSVSASLSAAACNSLMRSEAYTRSDVVFAYNATSTELNPLPLVEKALSEGRIVALPRVKAGTCDMEFYQLSAQRNLSEQLESGAYGIMEPVKSLPLLEPESLRGKRLLLVTPGLAFTKDGRRLGHGKGFYDRYIPRLLNSGVNVASCGFCYDCQIVEDLPCDSLDFRMNKVVTESHFFESAE